MARPLTDRLENIHLLLPSVFTEQNEPFVPVSVEHVLKHSTFLNRANHSPLTPNQLQLQHRQDAKSIFAVECQPPDPHLSTYWRYGFHVEAPVYLRLLQYSPKSAEIRMMYVFNASQVKACWRWSPRKADPDVKFFDLSLTRVGTTQWALNSFSYWHQDRYMHMTGHKVPKAIYLSPRTHEISLDRKSLKHPEQRWRHPTIQWVSGREMWTKLAWFRDITN